MLLGALFTAAMRVIHMAGGQDRRNLLLHLVPLRARHDRELRRHPRRARALEPDAEPVRTLRCEDGEDGWHEARMHTRSRRTHRSEDWFWYAGGRTGK